MSGSRQIQCPQCKAQFPILGGVAILVSDLRNYVLSHAKGIASLVPDSELPREFQKDFRQARQAQLDSDDFETDLESQRVVSLYYMNHYLSAAEIGAELPESPLKAGIAQYWDRSLFFEVDAWVPKGSQVVELGCSVGGLGKRLAPRVRDYLGMDQSFRSIAWARHLLSGGPEPGKLKIPHDLMKNATEAKVLSNDLKNTDFVVADFENPPLAKGGFDVAIALNTLDMLAQPRRQPEIQHYLLKKGGLALQSSPYIWMSRTARKLKGNSSVEAALELYRAAGFEVTRSQDLIPWLFFKQSRQMELYLLHLFAATAE